MKTLQFFTAPYLLISAFLLILISGEMLGGPYLLYLLLALPHGGIHALLAIGGILCLVLAHTQLNWAANGILKLIANTLGVLLLTASLCSFFYNDTGGYNISTFEQAVPLGSMIITGLIALLFLGLNVSSYLKASRQDPNTVANSH
ncbi:hypothetical protein BUE76_23305 [Cnuella takakiae]|nr:hypothetical protein BUE76_23305 [Cnuella takakiae]